ncbi:hypothetical protein A2U01_0072745, partial [Trifolium medium]|nr:hypothetical protein [Trifolium medium]
MSPPLPKPPPKPFDPGDLNCARHMFDQMPKRNCAFLLCSGEDVITINVDVNNLASYVPLPDTKPFDP